MQSTLQGACGNTRASHPAVSAHKEPSSSPRIPSTSACINVIDSTLNHTSANRLRLYIMWTSSTTGAFPKICMHKGKQIQPGLSHHVMYDGCAGCNMCKPCKLCVQAYWEDETCFIRTRKHRDLQMISPVTPTPEEEEETGHIVSDLTKSKSRGHAQEHACLLGASRMSIQ